MVQLKIKVFTHIDLDGVSCGEVIRYYYTNKYGKNNIDIEISYVNHYDIDKKVKNYVTLNKDVDVLFITDIAVSEETCEFIENKLGKDKLHLVDHHGTAKYLENKFDWVTVKETHDDGKLSSATSLLYDYLNIEDEELREYCEYVRLYDTWDWHKLSHLESKKLNDLLYLIGRKNFINRFNGEKPTIKLSALDKALLEIEQDRIDRYLNAKSKQLVKREFLGYKVGFVVFEQYGSELGNYLVLEHEDIDFVAMLNVGSKRISFITNKDDLDLGKNIASKFGGGGHPKASGCSFVETSDELIWNSLINLGFSNL